MAMLDEQSPMQFAVCLYTPRAVLRGMVAAGRFSQLLDLLNHPAPVYLPLVDAQVLPPGGGTWSLSRARLWVSKEEILFGFTAAEADAPKASNLLVEKIPLAVGCYVGDYRIEGTLHVLDRLPWDEFLTGPRDHFLALTDATITSASDDGQLAQVGFLALNRHYVRILYEE
jgi:hypothetical protein